MPRKEVLVAVCEISASPSAVTESSKQVACLSAHRLRFTMFRCAVRAWRVLFVGPQTFLSSFRQKEGPRVDTRTRRTSNTVTRAGFVFRRNLAGGRPTKFVTAQTQIEMRSGAANTAPDRRRGKKASQFIMPA
ncbi:hypothetical protein IE4771_PB00196 (plasmid) [Rhizobium etli bv. mimosae str. IE4771]|uniref:Uncharacterized protein n=1 Tax=Rhizobium etli bv. mimosae str. IE4771 TaxID=1432050 RepID=A0A060IDZ7_RHIET|nr:hypothetical protein IE4771_PB00196 [Rhizobium sp. IE4771]